MTESPMIGARCPVEWQVKIKDAAQMTGRTEAAVVREALGQYLGVVNPEAIASLLDNFEERLSKLEAFLSF